MCDQTLKRATHPSSKIYTCLWKSSPDYPSVFPDAFQIRHTEAPSWGGWSFWQLLRAARSAYTHLFIDPGQINVVSRPSSRHSLAQHTPTTSTKLILVTGVTGIPPLLSRERSLLNELFCARWTKKCNWNQHHCQSSNNHLSTTNFERQKKSFISSLPHEMTTEHRKAPTHCHWNTDTWQQIFKSYLATPGEGACITLKLLCSKE